ncbi:MAG: type II toxin-antitoxin system RelE/ParE family toxin [Lentisphaerae bacterium]|nr:type II toxin-antitoxin system RelE/ParE family toxin [Lentisphaerota bacterium]
MKLQILDMAREDLVEGFYFYEEKEEGLGDYFLSNLFADIESLRVFGGIHKKVYKKFYRALSKRFPFAIYYTIEGDTVWVRAMIDCRRRPSWIRQHLGKA